MHYNRYPGSLFRPRTIIIILLESLGTRLCAGVRAQVLSSHQKVKVLGVASAIKTHTTQYNHKQFSSKLNLDQDYSTDSTAIPSPPAVSHHYLLQFPVTISRSIPSLHPVGPAPLRQLTHNHHYPIYSTEQLLQSTFQLKMTLRTTLANSNKPNSKFNEHIMITDCIFCSFHLYVHLMHHSVL